MAKIMTDQLKYQLARELGVAHLVDQDYWGRVSSRDCGKLVRQAIERVERQLADR
ncbi:MAG: small, acid-soluble spore protein, alpha/beta type [Bacillota bacterium]